MQQGELAPQWCSMVLDGEQKPDLAPPMEHRVRRDATNGRSIASHHQLRAGRQLHPGSSPLGDVRQARVAGVGVLWLETGMGLESSMDTHSAAKFPAAILREVERECSVCCTEKRWCRRGNRGVVMLPPGVVSGVTGDSCRPSIPAHFGFLPESHRVGHGSFVEWSMLLWAGGGELPDPIDGAVAHFRHRTSRSVYP
jgi:hypothetical protein